MKIALTVLLLISMKANAFHAVTEILPGGEMLICKDYGQVKRDEFPLPIIGRKIALYYKDFHFKRKTLNEFYEAKIGNATIVEAKSLVGAMRIKRVPSNFNSRPMTEAKMAITGEEASLIDQNCVVAIADKGLVVDELAAIVW